MKMQKKTIQLILIFFGIFLIIATYFFYPQIEEKKIFKKQSLDSGVVVTDTDSDSDTFVDVEYKAFYDFDLPFTVKSDTAYILKEEPDLVFMSNMRVALNMRDGRIVTITSDKGIYNKITYDCFFEDNVKATDEETIILAKNLDLLVTEDMASIYNNVNLINTNGTLQADKVQYNFETKNYRVSMYNTEKVKIKLIR